MNDDSKSIHVYLAPLLEPGATARAAIVGGARVGDPAETLCELPLTEAEPQARYLIRNGAAHERLADGTEVPWPLAARIDVVVAEGGWVRSDECSWCVANGRVARIVVRGAELAMLQVRVQEDIERRFGGAEGTDRPSPTGTNYYYPSRDLTLCWNARLGTLECVMLGPVSWVDPVLTARDLVVQLAEAQHRLEKYAWREPPAEDHGATVRYQRLRALCTALGLPTVAALLDGSFLGDEHDERCAALIERLRVAGGFEHDRKPFPTSPARLYQDLLRYRLRAQVLLVHNAGWLECADMAQVAIIKATGRVNERLAELLEPIEELLGEFLDPEQRRVTRSVLVREFGYPELEPKAVDFAEDCGDYE